MKIFNSELHPFCLECYIKVPSCIKFFCHKEIPSPHLHLDVQSSVTTSNQKSSSSSSLLVTFWPNIFADYISKQLINFDVRYLWFSYFSSSELFLKEKQNKKWYRIIVVRIMWIHCISVFYSLCNHLQSKNNSIVYFGHIKYDIVRDRRFWVRVSYTGSWMHTVEK